MTEIIDLGAERNKREQPDPQFVSDDQWGRPIYMFSASYTYDSLTGPSRWTFNFWAYDHADAQARLEAIKAGAVVDGQIYEERPA